MTTTEGVRAGDYTFSTDNGNGNGTITGYVGSGGEVNLPNTIDGQPVVHIGSSAFEENNNISTIIIGDNVASIGYAAFRDCGLTIRERGQASYEGL
jgi:hypothetical protein